MTTVKIAYIKAVLIDIAIFQSPSGEVQTKDVRF